MSLLYTPSVDNSSGAAVSRCREGRYGGRAGRLHRLVGEVCNRLDENRYAALHLRPDLRAIVTRAQSAQRPRTGGSARAACALAGRARSRDAIKVSRAGDAALLRRGCRKMAGFESWRAAANAAGSSA